MEALNELCDLVATHPDLLPDKLTWLSSRCPAPQPSRSTRFQLHSLLALTRLLSYKIPTTTTTTTTSSFAFPLVNFFSSNAFLSPSFWPQSFSPPPYLSTLLKLASNINADVISQPISSSLLAALDPTGPVDPALARAFLAAAAASCPPLLPSDAAPVIARLLGEFGYSNELTPVVALKGKAKEVVVAAFADDTVSEGVASENGGGMVREEVVRFEEEAVEELERTEIAFRLLGQMLERSGVVGSEEVEKVRNAAARQVRSLPEFLKVGVWFICFNFVSNFFAMYMLIMSCCFGNYAIFVCEFVQSYLSACFTRFVASFA